MINLSYHNTKTIFTSGCFYLVTYRHIVLFQTIKKIFNSYKLIVGVNSVKSQEKLKHYPIIFTDNERVELLRALKEIDDVVLFDDDTPVNIVKTLQPDFVVKGIDYLNKEVPEAKYSKYGLLLLNIGLSDYKHSTRAKVEKIAGCNII